MPLSVKWKAWHASKESGKHLNCKPVRKPIRLLRKQLTWRLNKRHKPMQRPLQQLDKEREWFSIQDHNQQTPHLQAVAVF
jgi:hypothetical protein